MKYSPLNRYHSDKDKLQYLIDEFRLLQINISIIAKTIQFMHMLCRQERIQIKPVYYPNAVSPKLPESPQKPDQHQHQIANQQEQNFRLSMVQNRKSQQNMRKIKRSVINRACINVANFSCKALPEIPPEIMKNSQMKLKAIQKLDLSYNNLWDISAVFFEEMTSLKELVLNDNKISQLPVSQINKCKSLKLINVNNNQMYILHAFNKISYLQAKNNPFNLITAELIKLPNLQFFAFDWLEFLLDNDVAQYEDKYKEYTLHYSIFKKTILQKIDYQSEHNSHFCDFNCYFSIRFGTALNQDAQMSFLSKLIVKSTYKNNSFFFNYLKSFKNQINYPKLTYNNKLLLEVVFESNSAEALQLFCLKKSNYTQLVSLQNYFQSLKLCCRYANYQMFRYLFEMKKRKKSIQDLPHISALIHQVLYRYSKQKESDKMLFELVGFYVDVSGYPIKIKIPHEFNSRIFKSLSYAMLGIYQHQWMFNYFQLDFDKFKTTPLHFAMKSRNQELIQVLLGQQWSVFDKNENGLSCKFVPGSSQISRKLIWKREKAQIKKQFRNRRSLQLGQINQKMPKQPSLNLNQSIKNRIGYSFLQPNFIVYRSPKQSILKPQSQPQGLLQSIKKQSAKGQILPHLLVRAKQFQELNWMQHYLKKIINIDIISYLLQKLSTPREENLTRRNELWKKTMQILPQIFQLLAQQNNIIQYQVLQAIFHLNQTRQGRTSAEIQVETQRISIDPKIFWCCQAVSHQ